MRGKHEINMTEGPLWGKIAAFTVPLMITGFLQLLYNAADNVVVGRYAVDKEASLAAVGSTGALINLIVNLFIGRHQRRRRAVQGRAEGSGGA